MTQITVPPAVCNECRKEILAHLAHHSLAQPDPGKSGFGIHCHEEPVTGAYVFASFALKLALEQRAALLLKEAELKACRAKYKSDTQSNEAALKLKVETEAGQQFEVTRLGLVTTHETLMKDLKGQLADALQKLTASEQKCSANEALHQDQVNGLKQEIRESEKTSEILLNEKTVALEQLAESERNSTELQSQLEEANEKTEQMRQHHRRFSENTLKICGVISTLGKRVVVLEKKLGIDDMDDIRRIYREYTGEEAPDMSMDDAVPAGNVAPKVVPTPPAPPPAPAVIATATSPAKNGKSAFLVEVHTPVPQAAPVRTTVLLDDASPDSASDASADDEDDGVADHQVVEVKDADHEDDDVSPEEPAHPTCTFCHDKPAVGRLKFVDKETGAKQELLTCDPQAHGTDFLRYLQAKAKGKNWSNMDANDISNLFT
jgi:hypothetical protein